MIFSFSAQNATESAQTSESFTKQVLSVFPEFRALPQEKQIETVQGTQSFVRKAAHFCLYAGLGSWVYLSLCFLLKKKLRLYLTPVICLLYAVTDEVHQLFSAGRACEIRDIVIDTLGACVGMAAVVLCIFFVRHIQKKRCARGQKGV